MSVLLQINSSPRGADSVSRQLTDEFVTAWRQKHPNGRVITRDLNAATLPLVDPTWIGAVFTPADSRTAEQKAALATSDTLIEELETADEYVIGLPMHNFSIPTVLKAWLDQIVRAGRTFTYSETGPMGLLKNKKAIFLVASGGAYPAGSPLEALNHVEPYLRTIFGFVGVKDVSFIKAEGLAQAASGKVDLVEYLLPIRENVRAQAISN
jgi:FMN-dependent NADH-azoreductase